MPLFEVKTLGKSHFAYLKLRQYHMRAWEGRPKSNTDICVRSILSQEQGYGKTIQHKPPALFTSYIQAWFQAYCRQNLDLQPLGIYPFHISEGCLKKTNQINKKHDKNHNVCLSLDKLRRHQLNQCIRHPSKFNVNHNFTMNKLCCL